jgi:DNA (cytosine-5)-methyltransferase 1
MRAVSLVTGAGGLDLGCEAAGFTTIAAVESAVVARDTLELNQNKWFPALKGTLFDDILELEPEQLLDAIDCGVGEVELVHGGPPCTPFSKSGYWLAYKRAGQDPKASLLDEFARMVDGVRPKSFLMENVYGLAYSNHNRPVLERFVAEIRRSGYSFDLKVMLAADYGVPQLRQRLVCTGIREDLLDVPAEAWGLSWPTPTHSGPHETRTTFDHSLVAHRTADEAFEGLTAELNPPEPEEVVAGTFQEDLIEVPPGGNYLHLTAHRGHPRPRFQWRSRYWTFLLKLHPERPSPTIQGQPGPWVGPFHWEDRRLRVAELKRLMGFPDDFAVLGTRRDQQLQLGNAVPPRLGQVVAEQLAAELVRLGALDSDHRVAAAA